MASWKARTSTGVRVYFKVVYGGALATGIDPGDFTAVLIEPGDSDNAALTVAESTQQSGIYYTDIPSAFLTTYGTGHYGISVGVHSGGPPPVVDDEVLIPLEVNVTDLDFLATGVVGALNAETYDGRAFSDIFIDLLAMAAGKIVQSPAGTYTFYERNNTTPRFTLTISGTDRTRS